MPSSSTRTSARRTTSAAIQALKLPPSSSDFEGGTLADRITEAGGAAEALTIASQVTTRRQGPPAGHLHRDLKPGNVMLTRSAPSCWTRAREDGGRVGSGATDRTAAATRGPVCRRRPVPRLRGAGRWGPRHSWCAT